MKLLITLSLVAGFVFHLGNQLVTKVEHAKNIHMAQLEGATK
jgi:hypothetical protein